MSPFHFLGLSGFVSSSVLGQCQFCEPTGLANPADIFHVNPVGPLLMTFDVSASKQALAFGDSEGCVHLWTDSPEPSFNPYSRETEFALPCLFLSSLFHSPLTHFSLIGLLPTPLQHPGCTSPLGQKEGGGKGQDARILASSNS
jgi:hypothetical protein